NALDNHLFVSAFVDIDTSVTDITVGANAKIHGGAVTLAAKADAQHLDATGSFDQSAPDLALFPKGVSRFLQIGGGASVARPTAHIDIAAGADVNATTFIADSQALALAVSTPIVIGVGPAIGVVISDAHVNVNGSITTTGDATIRSTIDEVTN